MLALQIRLFYFFGPALAAGSSDMPCSFHTTTPIAAVRAPN